jgi:hypothetical protein
LATPTQESSQQFDKQELHRINEKIVALEGKLEPQYRTRINNGSSGIGLDDSFAGTLLDLAFPPLPARNEFRRPAIRAWVHVQCSISSE